MNTNFKAGGLRIDDQQVLSGRRVATPSAKMPMKWYDGRCFCLPSSNQGQSDACAGFTMAGYIEVKTWEATQIAKQIDGHKIHAEAKRLDGDGQGGTTLTQVVKAAKNLGLIRKNLGVRTIRTKKQVQYALHKHKVVMAGMMVTSAWNRCGKDGWIPDVEEEAIGGHGVLFCQYNDDERWPTGVGFQNSWMPWGCGGFGRMTWDMFERDFLYAVVLE